MTGRNSNNNNNNNNNGFSLIEVVAALFIVSVGLVGIIGVVYQNLQAEDVNRDRLIASQLAQEGLELTRNIRDDNWLGLESWYNGISNPDDKTTRLRLDYQGNREKIDDIEEGVLQTNDEGYYVHDSAHSDSQFKRMITVKSETRASTSISCLIEWENRGRTHTYVADTVLYDWR